MFILGCHRSGTSLLTNILKSALERHNTEETGTAQQTIESNIDNPEGHHESVAIVDLNERLLTITNASWNHPFLLTPDWTDLEHYLSLNETRQTLRPWALKSNWIDKDPRLCLTREAYFHLLLKEVPSIAIIRHPFAVANSLLARDGMHSDRALALWMCYNHHLFNSCRSLPNDVLSFAFLRHYPKESSQRLSNAVASTATIPDWAIEQELEQKFVGDLIRSRPDQLLSDRASNSLRESCITLYDFCQNASKSKQEIQVIANEFKTHFAANLDELNMIFPANKISEIKTIHLERLNLENQRLHQKLQYSRTSYRRKAFELVRSASHWLNRSRKQSH